MQAEQEGRHAVGDPDGDDAERAALLEADPHQRDVVERVAELAHRDGEVERAEVRAAQEPERAGPGGLCEPDLARDVEDRVGHDPSLPARALVWL